MCSTDSYKLDEIDSLSTESVLSAMIDNCLFPFIRQYANVDQVDFKKKFIKLNIWLEKIIESDLFISVMNKYPVWSKDNGIITDFSI